MLSKLIKHEFRSTRETMLWLYAVFAVITVIIVVVNPFVIEPDASAPTGISTVLSILEVLLATIYIIGTVALGIITTVLIVVRFYRNVLGDQGYLTLTLPATRSQHMLAKLTVSTVWFFISMALILLSVFLMAATTEDIAAIPNDIRDAVEAGIPVVRWIAMGVLFVLLSVVANILMFYAAMSIGPNLLKNRLGGSILAYIIIYIATQFVLAIALAILLLPQLVSMNSSLVPESARFSAVENVEMLEGGSQEIVIASGSIADGSVNIESPDMQGIVVSPSDIASIDVFFAVMALVLVGIAVACWFITRHMLTKRLNLA